VYNSPLRAWRDADIAELLNLRTKSILEVDWMQSNLFGIVQFQIPLVWSFQIYFLIVISKFRRHKIRPTLFRMGEVMFWTLWPIKVIGYQRLECWTSWIQITYL
jgi:hypothetical protein